MFYELAELQDFTEVELRHTARSAAGLWRTMECSISAAMDLEKATIFAPTAHMSSVRSRPRLAAASLKKALMSATSGTSGV